MNSEHDRPSIGRAAEHALGGPTEPVAEITRAVRLVTQHRAALVRHVERTLGCAEDAEDVVQETCVRLMRARDFWRGEREVRAFGADAPVPPRLRRTLHSESICFRCAR
jgi:sigma-70-like protein